MILVILQPNRQDKPKSVRNRFTYVPVKEQHQPRFTSGRHSRHLGNLPPSLHQQEPQSRVMEAYEAKAYTVDDYKRRMAPLRATEAGLKAKRAEVAGELDHQTAVLARPEEVLQFASELSDFLENSPPKDRKQMLNRFVKCIWIE